MKWVSAKPSAPGSMAPEIPRKRSPAAIGPATPAQILEAVLDVPVDVDASRDGGDDAARSEDVQSQVEGPCFPSGEARQAGRQRREDSDEDRCGNQDGRVDVPRDRRGEPRAVRRLGGVPSQLGDDREGPEEQEGGDDESLADHEKSSRTIAGRFSILSVRPRLSPVTITTVVSIARTDSPARGRRRSSGVAWALYLLLRSRPSSWR